MGNRRNFLYGIGAASLASVLAETTWSDENAFANPSQGPVRFGLNTSTIRGQGLTIEQQIDVAAAAGYDAIEPWIRDLRKYVQQGGKLADLRSRIKDAGLQVVNAIGFSKWIADDPAARRAGFEQARQEMQMVKSIGGGRIAAAPVGEPKNTPVNLDQIAKRYRRLLLVGDEVGVVPQLELWGHSRSIHRLEQLAYVATAAAHPNACVLPDFYHIYKGGSDFAGLSMIEASRMHCFHLNDYPSQPRRESIGDKDRVFPGDGVCPLVSVIAGLIRNGFSGTFSLELFNPDYWKRDAKQVASEGLQKSRQVVAAAIASLG